MFHSFKRRIAQRLDRFLRHYTSHRTPEEVIAAYRAKGVRIGEGTTIYDSDLDGICPGLIEIGCRCLITHATILAHDDAPVIHLGRRLVAPVKIGDRVFIGHGALILPGVTIGNDSIVAARSVVTRDVSHGSVVAGIPARRIKSISSYRLDLEGDPNLLDIDIRGTCTIPQEAELYAAALTRHRPDLLT